MTSSRLYCANVDDRQAQWFLAKYFQDRYQDEVLLRSHKAKQYNEREFFERFNSRLKEQYSGRNIMVKGAQKVLKHLKFGVIAIFTDPLLKIAVS